MSARNPWFGWWDSTFEEREWRPSLRRQAYPPDLPDDSAQGLRASYENPDREKRRRRPDYKVVRAAMQKDEYPIREDWIPRKGVKKL